MTQSENGFLVKMPVTLFAVSWLNHSFTAIENDPNTLIEVSLEAQTITLVSTGEKESFDINGYKKHNLMNGFDDIDFLHNIKTEITAFAENSKY